MNIIAKGTLLYYIDKYPKAKIALLAWYGQFSSDTFINFNELKDVYGNASIVANTRVIFNIKENEYRLIVSINFAKQAAYIIWFGTHAAYDKIDTSAVLFDERILDYKNK